MSTTINVQAWPKHIVANKQFLPCAGYLRGILIDMVNTSYVFILNEVLEELYLNGKKETTDKQYFGASPLFFHTSLTPECFIDNPMELNLLLDWEAEICFYDVEQVYTKSEGVKFIFATPKSIIQKENLPESSYHVAVINTNHKSAFQDIFHQESKVTPNSMSVHTDVIKLHLNGYNPYYFGKTFNINNEKTDKLQALYNSAKTKTDTCQNCEFRHVCIDNRLPTQRESDGLWYHTTECNYNPYIAKWKGEEGYRTLAECGVKSDETGFSIDHERIAKINEELWGED